MSTRKKSRAVAQAVPPKPELLVVIDITKQIGNTVPLERAPTVLHATKKTAMAEAERLAAANVGRSFAVFSCVAIGQCGSPIVHWRTPRESDVPSAKHAF